MSEAKPISCEDALRTLLTYLDGELDDARRREVDHHLSRCRSCFSRAEFERRLRSHLVELGRQPVAPDFERRIRALIAGFTHP